MMKELEVLEDCRDGWGKQITVGDEGHDDGELACYVIQTHGDRSWKQENN